MIICAALKDRKTNAIFPGIRHSDIYKMLYNLGHKGDVIEGFVDEANNFYDRFEAYDYAVEHHQLPRTVWKWKSEKHERELYSEDLY